MNSRPGQIIPAMEEVPQETDSDESNVPTEKFRFKPDPDDNCSRIELGRGHSGVTYLGEFHRAGSSKPEPAALKCFTNWNDDDAYQAIKKEASLLRRLHHRGVVEAFGLFHDARTPILATRFVEGEKLTKLVERRPSFDDDDYITEALRWAALLGDVLLHLEENEVIHRDFKPENILIRSEEPSGPVLLDFGIGKSVGPNSSLTFASTLRGFTGNLPFASPEQFCLGKDCPFCKTKKCKVTFKTDVYGLGATLWYVFSGKFPVESYQGREYGDQVTYFEKMGRAKRQATLNTEELPDIPELRELLGEMLAADPDERPDAGDVLRRFRELYESRGEPLYLETRVEKNLRDWSDHLDELPPFREIDTGVQIAIRPIDYYTHRVWSRDQLAIDFEQGDGPFRLSYEEAKDFVEGLNAVEKDFRYRLPTFNEWSIAVGAATRKSGAGGRKFVIDEVGAELEWCVNPQGSKDYPECRWTVYYGEGEAQLALRHKEWPKGVLRLIREPRESANPEQN